MAMMLKQSAVVAVDGKIVTMTKKKHVRVTQNVKVMLIVLFFFLRGAIGRASFIMSLFHVVRQSIKSST